MTGRIMRQISGILALFLPSAASAQVIAGGIPGCDFVTGRFGAACIPFFIGYLIQLVFGLVGIFFAINIMYAGYEIAMSGIPGIGDKEKGKSRIIWSVVGFIVCACSFLILDLIISVLVERL